MSNENTHAEERLMPDRPPEKTLRPALHSAAGAADGDGWDIVDEQSWGSFPGSDSPSTWAGRDLPPESEEERDRHKHSAD
jgi:hypothetical protein